MAAGGSLWSVRLAGAMGLAVGGITLAGVFSEGVPGASEKLAWGVALLAGLMVLIGLGVGVRVEGARVGFLMMMPLGLLGLGVAYREVLWAGDVPMVVLGGLAYAPLCYGLSRREVVQGFGVEKVTWWSRGCGVLVGCVVLAGVARVAMDPELIAQIGLPAVLGAAAERVDAMGGRGVRIVMCDMLLAEYVMALVMAIAPTSVRGVRGRRGAERIGVPVPVPVGLGAAARSGMDVLLTVLVGCAVGGAGWYGLEGRAEAKDRNAEAMREMQRRAAARGMPKIYIDGMSRNSAKPSRDGQLTLEEVGAMSVRCPSIEMMSPVWMAEVEAACWERRVRNCRVLGVWPQWHTAEDRDVVLGRELTARDEADGSRVCVLNRAAVMELGLETRAVGTEITLGGRVFAVVGVMSPRTEAASDSAHRAEVVVPLSAARELNANGWVNYVVARATGDVYTEVDATLNSFGRVVRPGFGQTWKITATGGEYQDR